MGNYVHFTSLGCPRNLVDSEVMIGLLVRTGYQMTPTLEEADYLVVNTCAFLHSAREESKATIRELLTRKRKKAKVIITGCLVGKEREEVEQLFPEVHYWLGAGDLEGIVSALTSEQPGAQVTAARSYVERGESLRFLATPRHYAYLKIAEGCRKRCSYCLIPSIKGPLQSRPIPDLVAECRSLLDKGVQEVVLIAQDLGDYGKDLGKEKCGLDALLRALLSLEGNFWLRLLYLYPDEIDEALIALMASDRRLLPYLDLPLQHIHDDILKKMRRKTTSRQIRDVVATLRKKLPHIHLRTSFIVGFPGETEEQFEELLAFVQEGAFHHVGIFTYSREEGTEAARMEDQIPEEVKVERQERLAAAQQRVVAKWNRKMVGKRVEVVVEGYHPESKLLLVGRYFGQAPEVDGQVILNEWRAVRAFGERYQVEITNVAGYDLVGRVV